MSTDFRTPQVFFAYPSSSAIRREAIVHAARELAKNDISTVTWEDLRGSGTLVISKVLDAIDEATVFAADVTEPNENVLFELGYAIGSRKPVWLFRDDSHEPGNRWWRGMHELAPIEFSPFQNHGDLLAAFWSALPHEAPDLFTTLISPSLSQDRPAVLYLKSPHETEAESRLTPRIVEEEKKGVSAIVVDPRDSGFHPLVWYAEHIYRAGAVVAHFCSINREGHLIHNSRLALLSGLARGMDRPLLMLSENDYPSPVDYRDIMKSYMTGQQCREIADTWLSEVMTPVYRRLRLEGDRRRQLKLADDLKDLRLGEPVAEHEAEDLNSYFLETAQYLDLVHGSVSVFIGEKGTGKTANLLAAAEELSSDRRNLVCVIKPPSYELEDVIRLVRNYKTESRGYLVESIWKFLVYTEIARATFDDIESRPLPAPESAEGQFQTFVRDSVPYVLDDFAVRLESVVRELLVADDEGSSVGADRSRISEILHSRVLRSLRSHLGLVLSERNRVSVLVDNLDKAWDRGIDVEETSIFLLGLLSSIGRIEDDFRHEDHWREPVEVTLTVFLRSDIYEQIRRVAREPDKIQVSHLRWDNPDLLRRVIEARYEAGASGTSIPEDFWFRFFPREVRGLPPADYVLSRILPRPRDLVFFVRQAVSNAINARREVVEEPDVLRAEGTYSQFAVDALTVENVVRFPEIEDVLFGFMERRVPLSKAEVVQAITEAGVPPERIDSILSELIRSSFLGYQSRDGRQWFAYDAADERRVTALANRNSSSGPTTFTVHPAFRPFLEIAEG